MSIFEPVKRGNGGVNIHKFLSKKAFLKYDTDKKGGEIIHKYVISLLLLSSVALMVGLGLNQTFGHAMTTAYIVGSICSLFALFLVFKKDSSEKISSNK